jgi:predicted transcriptional regulator
MEELVEKVMNQNFVPVVDDRNIFIGIVTRRDIMQYFVGLNGHEESRLSKVI